METLAAYLTDGQRDGQGHPGAGRRVNEGQDAAGPFCTRCGVRNGRGGTVLRPCGHALD